MPWCPYSNIQEEGVVIPNEKIMFVTTPHTELAKEHTTMVTGIEMPTAPAVAGVIGQQRSRRIDMARAALATGLKSGITSMGKPRRPGKKKA